MKVVILLSIILIAEASWALQVPSKIISATKTLSNRIGNEGGGGGSSEKIKVFIVAQRAYKVIQANQRQFPEVQALQFRQTLEAAALIFTDEQLLLEGKPVDAINNPDDGTIMINRTAWSKMRLQASVQVSFIAHEILSLMRIEKTDKYNVSSRIAAYVSADTEPIFKWSCQSIKTDFYWSSTSVVGEGNTAAEAWTDLVKAAEQVSCTAPRCALVKYVDQEKRTHSPVANMPESCVKN